MTNATATDTNVWEPNPRQRALILAMTSYPYPLLARAARQLGISENTARKWTADSRFKAALADAHREEEQAAKADLQRRIQALKDASVGALTKAITSEDPSVQLRAAIVVFDRILGKPKERTEISGPDDGPLDVTIVFDRRDGA